MFPQKFCLPVREYAQRSLLECWLLVFRCKANVLMTAWNVAKSVRKHTELKSQCSDTAKSVARILVSQCLFFWAKYRMYYSFCFLREHREVEFHLASGANVIQTSIWNEKLSAGQNDLSPCQCNWTIKQSIVQLSLDTRWQTSFELLSLTAKCYSTWRESLCEISTEKDRVLSWVLADCKCQHQFSPICMVQLLFIEQPPL